MALDRNERLGGRDSVCAPANAVPVSPCGQTRDDTRLEGMRQEPGGTGARQDKLQDIDCAPSCAKF